MSQQKQYRDLQEEKAENDIPMGIPLQTYPPQPHTNQYPQANSQNQFGHPNYPQNQFFPNQAYVTGQNMPVEGQNYPNQVQPPQRIVQKYFFPINLAIKTINIRSDLVVPAAEWMLTQLLIWNQAIQSICGVQEYRVVVCWRDAVLFPAAAFLS